MKLIVKLVAVVAVVCVLLVIGLLVSKDKIIRQKAISGVEEITGFPLEVDALEVGLLSSKFVLKGCRLLNPEDFEAKDALVINELSADVKLLSLLTSTVKLRSVVVDIPTLNIETTKDGVNNFELLQKRIKEYTDSRDSGDKDSKPSDRPEKEKTEKPKKSLVIDELDIRLGKGLMVDRSKGDDPVRMELDLKINKHYSDVTDMSEVIIDLTAEIFQKTFMGLLSGGLNDLINEGLKDGDGSSDSLKEGAEGIEDQIKGLLKQFR